MSKRFILIIIILSFLVPFGVLIYLSLSTEWYYPSLLSHTFTLLNWESFLGGRTGILKSTGLSIVISLTVSVIATISGLFISRSMVYYTSGRWWLMSAYFPYVIAPVVLAVMLNYYFLQLGLSGTTIGVIAAQLLITLPYSIILFYGFWNRKIRSFENLADSLGGGFTDKVTHAILPSAKGLLTICFFQCFLISWFEYGLTQFIGTGKVETLTIMVYRFVTEANPYLAALAGTVLILPPIILLLINRKIIFRKEWSF